MSIVLLGSFMKTEQRIHALLEDRSFPRMVLIDGPWGIGKTFYVTNVLQPYLNQIYPKPFKTIYLSLYGVTSLNDFKDRLISIVYANNADFSVKGGKFLGFLGQSTEVTSSTKGVTALLSAASSVAKQILFNKLNNLVILLDDLERITLENVRMEVVGECLNLVETKNIKIVFVANKSKVGSIEYIEKAFGDVIYIKRSANELIDVVNHIYKDQNSLTEFQSETVLELIKTLKINNLRIIKRSIDRFRMVCSLFKEIEGVNYERVHSSILNASFRINVAIHVYGATLEEILETLGSFYNFFDDEDKRKLVEDRNGKIDELISPLSYMNENVVTYIAILVNNISDINIELNLPQGNSSDDRMLSYSFRYESQGWFNENLPKFKCFIFDDGKKPIYKWMKSCSVYLYMIDNGYVSGEYSVLIGKIKEILVNDDFEYEHEIGEMLDGVRHNIINDELREIFSGYLHGKISDSKQCNLDSFHGGFLQSWSLVSESAENDFEHKPFINMFTRDEFLVILNRWSTGDIYVF